MLEALVFPCWWRRRSVAPVASSAPPSGVENPREAERLGSAEILAQAQWLYEQHERRAQNCQNMAIAILTIVGTITALIPNTLPTSASTWHYVALGVVAVAGLVTMIQCLRVLAPRVRVNGLPAVNALRKFAHGYETLGGNKMPIPVTQFATDLLNPMRPTEPSPLGQSSENARHRTDALIHVYWWFAGTFVLVIVMSALFALLG